MTGMFAGLQGLHPWMTPSLVKFCNMDAMDWISGKGMDGYSFLTGDAGELSLSME